MFGSQDQRILIALGIIGLFGIITFALAAATLGTVNKRLNVIESKLSSPTITMTTTTSPTITMTTTTSPTITITTTTPPSINSTLAIRVAKSKFTKPGVDQEILA